MEEKKELQQSETYSEIDSVWWENSEENDAFKKPTIKSYLASSIFYEKDVIYNKYLTKLIHNLDLNIDLYSPVENADINDKTKFADSSMIFNADYKRLKETDLLIACIDGDVCPIGTAVEIGIFSELAKHNPHKFIIALFTDSRDGFKTIIPEKIEAMRNGIAQSQFSYTNLFLVGAIESCGILVNNTDDLCKEIQNYFQRQFTQK